MLRRLSLFAASLYIAAGIMYLFLTFGAMTKSIPWGIGFMIFGFVVFVLGAKFWNKIN